MISITTQYKYMLYREIYVGVVNTLLFKFNPKRKYTGYKRIIIISDIFKNMRGSIYNF